MGLVVLLSRWAGRTRGAGGLYDERNSKKCSLVLSSILERGLATGFIDLFLDDNLEWHPPAPPHGDEAVRVSLQGVRLGISTLVNRLQHSRRRAVVSFRQFLTQQLEGATEEGVLVNALLARLQDFTSRGGNALAMSVLKQLCWAVGLRIDMSVASEWDPERGRDQLMQSHALGHVLTSADMRTHRAPADDTFAEAESRVFHYLLALPQAFDKMKDCMTVVVDASRIGKFNTLNVLAIGHNNRAAVLPPQARPVFLPV